MFDRWAPRGRLLHVLVCLLPAVLLVALVVPAAQARTVAYTMQWGSRVDTRVRLDGDKLVGFRASFVPTTCPGVKEISSDDSFDVSLPAPVTLRAGRFTFTGRARSSYYSVADAGYGADFTVSAAVSPDHRLITGTVTLANATDPILSGCDARIAFMAIPTVPRRQWGADQHAQFTSQFVSFNAGNGVITKLRVDANFMCGGSVDSAEVLGGDYNASLIHADRAGRWRLRSYVLDGYGRIVTFVMTGRVSGRTAAGQVRISEPPGLRSVADVRCHGVRSWRAARPTPPAPPGPQAFFNWLAVRAPAGGAYRYYFAISGLQCSHGATGVRIVIAGRQTAVACRHTEAWASGPLTPGRSYQATATAIRVVGGRVVKTGLPVTQALSMPGASDHWRPIGKVPGAPPG